MPTALATIPPRDGENLAEELVEQRLAASVDRVPCSSAYRWDGEVHVADEEILLIKTTAERYDDVVELVERRHPYEVAPIERFDEADATPDFLEWRENNVAHN